MVFFVSMGGIDILGSNLVRKIGRRLCIRLGTAKTRPPLYSKKGKKGEKRHLTFIFFPRPQACIGTIWVLLKQGKTIASVLQEPYLEILARVLRKICFLTSTSYNFQSKKKFQKISLGGPGDASYQPSCQVSKLRTHGKYDKKKINSWLLQVIFSTFFPIKHRSTCHRKTFLLQWQIMISTSSVKPLLQNNAYRSFLLMLRSTIVDSWTNSNALQRNWP